MKFFIDTANIEEIKQAAQLGVLDGVATNSTLVSKVPGKFEDIIYALKAIVDEYGNTGVISFKYKNMNKKAQDISNYQKNLSKCFIFIDIFKTKKYMNLVPGGKEGG